jgi:hypothetical protein
MLLYKIFFIVSNYFFARVLILHIYAIYLLNN